MHTPPPARLPRAAVTATALAALLVGGCSGGASTGATGPSPSASAATTPSATTPSASTPTPSGPSSASSSSSSSSSSDARETAPRGEVVGTQVVSDGLTTPWGIARLPDGSHLVSLRDEARVVRITADGTRTDVPGTGDGGRVAGVVPGGEGGLLGLALDPARPDVLYAYLTSADDNRVVAMDYRDGRLGEPRVLLDGIGKARIHNGGRIALGPDGFLYVGTGDGGQTDRAQNRGNLGGKILRITRDGDPAPGNPFPGSPVWSLGHRNVQGLGFDGAGRMYASEFGQNTWDELNLIEPGRNYGWPVVEGMGDDGDRADGFTPPLRVWPTSEASPSGIAVGLGSVWVAALRGQRLWQVPLGADPGTVQEPRALLREQVGRVRAVEVQPDGTLLVLTDNASRSGDDGSDQLVRVRVA